VRRAVFRKGGSRPLHAKRNAQLSFSGRIPEAGLITFCEFYSRDYNLQMARSLTKLSLPYLQKG
jgi:hypothetical protein